MLNRNILRYIALSIILFSAILFHTTTTFAQPVCDNYPIIQCVVPGSLQNYTISENNSSTTAQAGEPRLVNPLDTTPLNTLWFRWSPQSSGVYAVDTSDGGSTLNTEIAVYRETGTNFAGLVKLGANDDWNQFAPLTETPQDFSNCYPERPLPAGESNLKSCVKFTATVGNTYVFQVDSSGNTATGPLLFKSTLISAPTAATSSIDGRVTNENGRGISRTTLSLTDINGNTRTATTNPFGYYRFADIESGQNYTLVANRKGYQFENNPRVINVSENIEGENFVGINPFLKRE